MFGSPLTFELVISLYQAHTKSSEYVQEDGRMQGPDIPLALLRHAMVHIKNKFTMITRMRDRYKDID